MMKISATGAFSSLPPALHGYKAPGHHVNVSFTGFGFMIDDGLHTSAILSIWKSFSNLSKKDPIEDLTMFDLIKLSDCYATKNYQVDYVKVLHPNSDIGDNNLAIIRQPRS